MLSTRAKALVVVSIIFPILALIAVGLRLYARRIKSLALKADDYVILVALAVSIGGAIPYIIGAVGYGIGKHLDETNPAQRLVFFKILFAVQFLYILSVAPIKISVLLFYRRIFPTRRFKIALCIVGVAVLLWTVVFFFATLFQASPISYNWTQVGTPTDYTVLYWVIAATDIFLDLVTLSLPLPLIWGLQLSTRRKWIVTAIFMLGIFICISSAVRLSYLVQFTDPNSLGDFTFTITNIVIWSVIEPCASVICACLPTFGPIFQAHTPESLIGSIQSFLRLSYTSFSSRNRSGNWSDKRARPLENSPTSSVRAFHKMSDDAVLYTNAQGTQMDDLESQHPPSERIFVQTKLSSTSLANGTWAKGVMHEARK